MTYEEDKAYTISFPTAPRPKDAFSFKLNFFIQYYPRICKCKVTGSNPGEEIVMASFEEIHLERI